MAFSDDYTDSETETDESTSVDSEAHSSDLDFLNDDSESEESEDGDSLIFFTLLKTQKKKS